MLDSSKAFHVVSPDGVVVATIHLTNEALLAMMPMAVSSIVRSVTQSAPVPPVDSIDSSEPPRPISAHSGKPKVGMREWLKACLGRSDGSFVKSKDLRTAWIQHVREKHDRNYYLSAYKFHDHLRYLGYDVQRVCGMRGTGSHIMGVFMRSH